MSEPVVEISESVARVWVDLVSDPNVRIQWEPSRKLFDALRAALPPVQEPLHVGDTVDLEVNQPADRHGYEIHFVSPVLTAARSTSAGMAAVFVPQDKLYRAGESVPVPWPTEV